jgi:hypothetical protein
MTQCLYNKYLLLFPTQVSVFFIITAIRYATEGHIHVNFIFYLSAVLGIEHSALCMLGRPSTTKLQTQLLLSILNPDDLIELRDPNNKGGHVTQA